MKKFLSVIVFSLFLFSGPVLAFRDVLYSSRIYDAVEHLVDQELIRDQGFFRPEHNVPADMFWTIIIRQTGFDSASFDPDGAPLPPNITSENDMAPILQEAVRLGLLDAEAYYQARDPIDKIEAVKVLMASHRIEPMAVNSMEFRQKVSGISKTSKNIPYVEAAYYAGFLAEKDIRPFKPYAPLKRRELAEWIYQYEQKQKKSPSTKDLSKQMNSRGLRWPGKDISVLDDFQIEYQEANEKEEAKLKISPKKAVEKTAMDKNFATPDGQLFEHIYEEIESRYRFPETLDPTKKEEMINAAISAMVEEMGDKYSSYIAPTKATNFKKDLEGEFEGIGAYVDMVNDQFIITAPIKGSPAESAGLIAGDRVTKVNNKPVAGQTQSEIVEQVKGPAGTKVLLTIARKNVPEKEVEVTRGKIEVPPVTLEWKQSVPIIGIHQFNHETNQKFREILIKEVLPKKPRGLVLDFRNNPGGYLTAAVEIGEYFLNQGDLIFSVEYKDRFQEYSARRQGELFDMENIVILQNQGTASASEIIITMLQDYGKAKVIGTKSLGKGTVQEISDFSNGGLLKLTIAKWLTPLGRWIHETGITPDIQIPEPTPEERMNQTDIALERAVRDVLGKQ